MEWEYKVITMRTKEFSGGKFEVSELETTMNELGRDEWELVAALGTNEGILTQGGTYQMVLHFKRPRR